MSLLALSFLNFTFYYFFLLRVANDFQSNLRSNFESYYQASLDDPQILELSRHFQFLSRKEQIASAKIYRESQIIFEHIDHSAPWFQKLFVSKNAEFPLANLRFSTRVYAPRSTVIIFFLLICIQILSVAIFFHLKRKIETEKNKRKDELFLLARKVSHDLRSPILALETGLAFLDTNPSNSKAILSKTSLRVKEIANELLNHKKSNTDTKYSKLTVVEISNYLNELVEEKLSLYKTNNIILRNNFDHNTLSKEVSLNVKQTDFKSILSNIIDNSHQACSTSTISIKCGLTTNNSLLVSIIDDGPGIAPKLIHKLGRKQIRSEKINGNGLGLHQAHKIIKKWGGKLFAKNNANTGATVEFTVPLS